MMVMMVVVDQALWIADELVAKSQKVVQDKVHQNQQHGLHLALEYHQQDLLLLLVFSRSLFWPLFLLFCLYFLPPRD